MNPTILCVDDEAAILSTTRLILEQAGYTVITAPDISAAVAAAGSHSVDLVLLDCLPNRQALIEAAQRANPKVRFLVCTGDASRLDPANEFEVLQKPVPPRVLLHRLAALLGR
jgi:DNA-binding response OmpR family regulator